MRIRSGRLSTLVAVLSLTLLAVNPIASADDAHVEGLSAKEQDTADGASSPPLSNCTQLKPLSMYSAV
jgi:hypothetical protein